MQPASFVLMARMIGCVKMAVARVLGRVGMSVLVGQMNIEFHPRDACLLAASDVHVIAFEPNFFNSRSSCPASTPRSMNAPMNMSPLMPLKMSK